MPAEKMVTQYWDSPGSHRALLARLLEGGMRKDMKVITALAKVFLFLSKSAQILHTQVIRLVARLMGGH